MSEQVIDKDRFRSAYERVVELYRTHLPPDSAVNLPPSLTPEAFEACWAAERHRQYWRPERLRFALVAESHVYTDDDDLRAQVRTDILPDPARGAPEQFVRLIYCLAYGDSSLLTRPLRQPNTGTPEYWKLFATCASLETAATSSAAGKIAVLLALKERGVWLADASIHACMNPRFGRRDKRRNIECYSRLYREVLAASWDYVKGTLQGAEKVWIVGKLVRDNLIDAALEESRWIYQPGCRMKEAQRKFQYAQLERLIAELPAR